MTWEIRPICTEDELLAFTKVQLSAYPAMNATLEALHERMSLLQQKDQASHLFGVFAGQQLLGGMRMLDFQLNYHGKIIPAGGIGSVAVDLPEKKRGIAKSIVQFFIEHYRQQGAYLTLLYPFRPDFYQQMGFGFGPKRQQYCFTPASLPCPSRRHGLTYLTEADLPELRRFSDEYAEMHHGFCRRSDFELQGLVRLHAPRHTLVGWKQHGKLAAYMAFSFRPEGNFLKNSLIINEWLWSGQDAFLACSSFLHSQADQIHRIIHNTVDDAFHFALSDVRNGSDHVIPHVYHESNTAGVGLMYRATGLADLLTATDYRDYNGQTLDLKLTVNDTFRPDNAGIYNLRFVAGKLQLLPDLTSGIEAELDVSDFVALLMGSVRLQDLYRLGRVRMPAEEVARVDRLWRVDQLPECITGF